MINFEYLFDMKQVEVLRRKLHPGKVYRREDLQRWSSAIDRHLQEMQQAGVIKKIAGGLYYVPEETAFGKAPADDYELVKAFLKDSRFVITSPNDYNSLGLGTTQLYNTKKVYNLKRHGNFKLGNRSFHFVRKSFVPTKVTQEFLLVDLMNNLKYLSEEKSELINRIKEKAKSMNQPKLKYLAGQFGTIRTKKFFDSLLQNNGYYLSP